MTLPVTKAESGVPNATRRPFAVLHTPLAARGPYPAAVTGVARPGPVEPSAEFTSAVQSLRQHADRTDIALTEVPAPSRLAPYSFAFSADVASGEDDLATGRLIVLHDPAGHETWQSTFRMVTYVQAEVEPDLAADPLLPEVGWSWLLEALSGRGLRYEAPSGTVTRAMSASFGSLDDRPATAEVEIRASWSPLDHNLGPHLSAWCELLRLVAGLPASSDVAALRPRRAR